MPKSKIKTLVLLILLLCNLGLMATVLPTQLGGQRLAQRTGQQLESLYASYNLTLDGSSLPDSQPLYILEAQYDEQEELSAVRALLGDAVLAEEDSGSYQNTYTAAGGSCTVRRGNIEAQFTDGPAASGSLTRSARRLLDKMGFSVASLSQQLVNAETSTVTALQSLLGVPVFSSGLTLRYTAGQLVSVQGVFYPLADTLTCLEGQTCMSCASALVAFLEAREQTGWIGSAILSVQQGYRSVETAAASTLRLIPVWQLVTDAGTFYVDGITGEVSAADA